MTIPSSKQKGPASLPMVSSADPPPFNVERYQLTVDEIALQPTTLCNLACDYCYLPEKHRARHMSVGIVESVAEYIRISTGRKLLLWHCGEPLAIGVDRFRGLLEPLTEPDCRGKISHVLQTNATLIDEAWCDLFREYQFRIGVSIDGPKHLNARRVDRAGRCTFDRTVEGMRQLRANGLPFSVLVVVDQSSVSLAREIYEFVRSAGADMLCVNIEQPKGVHKAGLGATALARQFWRSLYDVWKEGMEVPIREFRRTIGIMHELVTGERSWGDAYRTVELMPTIASNGDVYLLSPDFVDVKGVGYEFVIGNVNDEALADILRLPLGHRHVTDYLAGVEICRKACEYFSFCGGGFGSNKYFEKGTLAASETQYCRNKVQALTEALLEAIEDEKVESGRAGLGTAGSNQHAV